MSDEPRYKSINLNDDVAITLPAYVWVGFVAAYNSTKWEDMHASIIGRASLREMLDPVYLREQEAQHQEHLDSHPRSLADLIARFGEPPNDPRLDPPTG